MTTSDLPEWQERPQWPELDFSHYLDTVYGVLFYPVRTFQTVADLESLPNALLCAGLMTVLIVSALTPVVHVAGSGGNLGLLLLSIPLHTVAGLFMWVAMALIVGLLAYAFTAKSRLRHLLCLTGLATLPWVLMGPVILFKVGLGTLGVALSAIAGLLVWLWTVLLFALAITVTYRMTADRVLIVLVAPFVMMLVFFAWMGGFVSNIIHLGPMK